MAILKNLIVNGSSKFLNKAYFQDVSISGTATLSSLSLSGNLSVTGNTTVTGTLGVTGNATFGNITATGTVVLSRNQDASGTANYSPALIVGGTAASPHLELDANEVQAKSSGTSTGSLYLNNDGGAVYLSGGSVYASGSTFVATTGNIATLNSTNVNVTNNLRANHYDLQTVAQLGGSFYVSPTVKFPNSGTTLAVTKSGATLTLTIKDSSITSATMAGVIWTAGSGVKVSGTINGVVTGTMDGTVSSINTSSHTLTLSVSGENSGNVQASPSGSPYNASQFKDLSVMLYTRKQNGTNKMINTASGAIASFTDGGNNVPVKQLVVDIKPVQDLHGYDSPWPAGGGKNKLVLSDINQTTNGVTISTVKDSDGNVIAYKFTGTATAYTAFVLGSAQSMGLVNGQQYTLTDGNGRSTFQLAIWDATSNTWAARAHNNPQTFTYDSSHTLSIQIYVDNGQATNLTLYPMIRLSSVSDATFAPYSNICPITGHTSAVVTRSKKNLLKNNNTATTYTNNGVTFTTNSNGTITANGTATADAQVSITITGLTGKVKFTGCPSGGGSGKYDIYPWDSNVNARPKKWDGTSVASGDFGGTLQEILIPFGHSIQINCRVSKNYTANNVVFSPMIVSPTETSTTFESYSGQTYTINLNGTRYGGTLDVGTGVLTVTHTYVDVNAFGSVSSGTNAGGLHWVDTTTAVFDADKSSYCSMLTRKDGDAGWLSTSPCYSMGADKKVRIYCGESTTALFKSAYADLQIVCGSISPTTVQLSHTEVRTLSGYNNIWSNTGDTNLIYESSQYDTTSNYNVGIWMNCYDQANSSSTIRVYNGSSRWPNVFLGNMTNADLPRVNGNAPYGYGLYSDNVFLRGIISATGGLIGNWTIGQTGMYYDTDVPSSTSITMIPGGTTASTTSIGGSSGSKSWVFTVKNLFGVDTSGALYSTSGKIGGWDIGTDRFSSHSTNPYVLLAPGVGTNNDVFYVRTGSGTTADPYKWPIVMRANGYFYADNATISGKITATSGYFGGSDGTNGWEISTGKIQSTYTYSNATKYMGIGTYNHSWAFYSGASTNGGSDGVFKVGHGGELYATNAHITGEVTATSGTIGGFHISASSNQGTSSAGGHIYTNSLYRHSGDGTTYEYEFGMKGDAAENPSSSSTTAGNLAFYVKRINKGAAWNSTNTNMFYVTHKGSMYCRDAEITGKLTAGANSKIGPWDVTTTSIYKKSNTLGSDTSGAAYFGDSGLSVGNKFKVDASGVVTLGLSNGYHATMDTDSFDVLNGSTMLATFGTDSVIGNTSTRCVSINSDGFKFNSAGKTAFNVGIDNRSGSTASEATGYTFPSNPEIKYINSIPYYLLTTISSDRTVIEVDVYAEMADPEAESRIFFDWVIDNNKLYINCDEVDQKYDAAVDYVSYIYTTNTNTQAPYCIIGDNAYSSSNTAGTMSFAQGYKCLALGAYSTSVGQETLASGTSSFSLGKRSEAHGAYSFAGGALSTSKDFVSFAYGYKSNAWGKHSVAFGNQDLSTWIFEILITSCDTEYGDITFRITQRAETFEDYISTGSILVSTDNQYIFEDIVVTSGSGTSTITFSCVLYGGHFPTVNSVLHVRVNPPGSYGNGAMSVNACCASGISSTALGIGTTAAAGGSLAIGMYNIPESNVLFSIGNGTMLENHNAMTVDLLGNVVASGNIACTGISAPLFIEKSFQTGNLSVGANAAFSINFNQLSGYSIPNGYRAIAFSHISVNNNYLYFRWMNPVSSYNGAIAVGRNTSASSQTFVLQVRIMFAQTSLFGT